MIVLLCKFCGKPYRQKASRALTSKFCSNACKFESQWTRARPVPRPCKECGTIFKPARHRGDARFCSKSCVWEATHGQAFNARIARESANLRGDLQRGRGDGKSYRKLYGRHEHRVIAETKIGRALTPKEVVHHVDGDIHNNDPSNLKIMSQGEHMREHGLGIPGQRPRKKNEL